MNKILVLIIAIFGFFNPVKISLNDLLQYHLKATNKVYKAYYFDGKISLIVQKP